MKQLPILSAMKAFVLTGLLMMSSAVSAQMQELPVWGDGTPPNDNGITQEKDGNTDWPGYTNKAILYLYPAKNGNGMAVLACPGGGYTHLSMRYEGKDMAEWFNAQGITYAVLRYRMPNGHHEVPLSDAQQAIRLMRQHAKEWNIKKLGIMGSSAGGHLASTAATHFDAETRPDFQILFYPVVTMDPAYTHKGSHDNLLGKNPSKELEKKYSNELQVTPQTPPAFIMHSSDDGVVPAANSVNYYMALVKNGVPASLHTYPVGGHGWGFGDSFIYKRQWTGELEKWLREISK